MMIVLMCWLCWLWVGWLCRSRSRSNQLTHKKFVHRRETTSNDFHHDGQLLQIFVLYICLNLDPIGVLHHVPIYFEYALTCPMMNFFSHIEDHKMIVNPSPLCLSNASFEQQSDLKHFASLDGSVLSNIWGHFACFHFFFCKIDWHLRHSYIWRWSQQFRISYSSSLPVAHWPTCPA